MTNDPFFQLRSLLFTVAYEMLGSAADAEDVVQETWLRWADVDRAEVREPRAYLVRAVTRQALNRLRTLARKKEEYVGEWLPEPLCTSPEVAENLELAESVSMAMLTVLETLGRTERVVFVLREVFDVSYEEIAEVVGKSEAAVRQVAHRARAHVAARRPRMQLDRTKHEATVAQFLRALTSGDMRGLVEVLAAEAVLVADGGGVVPAIRKPIEGAQAIAQVLAGFRARVVGAVLRPMWLNGALAARIDIDGTLDTAISVIVDGDRITHIYAIRNPHKLTRIEQAAPLSLETKLAQSR